MDKYPTATLSTGVCVANFSSAHPIPFKDGTILAPCSTRRSEALALIKAEEETPHAGGWTDVRLKFVLSDAVREELDKLEADEEVDITLVPFPVLSALRDAGLDLAYGKVRAQVMSDRIKKVAHHDRFSA